MKSGTPFPVALITGSSRGLGRAIATELHQNGWRVAASNRAAGAGKISSEKTWAEPHLDVTSQRSIGDAVHEVVAAWGTLDLLVNNAGLAMDALLANMSEKEFDQVLDVNLSGAMRCARAVLPIMTRQNHGQIINISSFSGLHGAAGQANYAAAKAGLVGLTRSLAREGAPANIRTNLVFPGVLPTGMYAALSPENQARLAEANVLGRINSLEEVARFIGFLATTENISGQCFQLDSRVATGW